MIVCAWDVCDVILNVGIFAIETKNGHNCTVENFDAILVLVHVKSRQ